MDKLTLNDVDIEKDFSLDRLSNYRDLTDEQEARSFFYSLANVDVIVFEKPVYTKYVYLGLFMKDVISLVVDDSSNDDYCYVFTIINKTSTEIDKLYAMKSVLCDKMDVFLSTGGDEEGACYIE